MYGGLRVWELERFYRLTNYESLEPQGRGERSPLPQYAERNSRRGIDMSKGIPEGFVITTHVTGRGFDLWRKQSDGTANYVSWHEHAIDAIEFAEQMAHYGYFATSVDLFEREVSDGE